MGPGLSTTAVIYCLFGGSGTLIGPVIGTAAIEVLTYVLADIDAIKQFWPVILGLVLLGRGDVPAQGHPRPASCPTASASAPTAGAGAAGEAPWRCSRSAASARSFRTLRALDGVDLDVAGRHLPRPDRAQRLGQEHAAEGDRRRPFRRQRQHRVRRPRHHPRHALRARPRRPQPEIPDHRRAAASCRSTTTCCWRCSRAKACRSAAVVVARGALDGEVSGLLERFRLIDRADDLAGELSHGEQQWLEIAMALALKPKLLLLDEPTGGMSPEERRVTGELLRADQGALRADHRRARPALHPRHLRSAHRARPGQGAGPGRRRDDPALAEGPAGVHHPCLTQLLLEVDGLSAGYGRSQALFDVSIKAPARGAIAVLGRNGAGKSTLLKTLFGELAPMAGTIRFDGAAVRGASRPSGGCGAASATCRRSMPSSPS